MARRSTASRAGRKGVPAFRTVIDSRVERVHTVRAGQADGRRVRLTGYDLLTGPWYTPLTFFYRDTLDGAALRDSLARTLRRYPLLAGRLERDADGGLSVVCSDAGVRFTDAACADPMRDYGHGLRAQPVIGDLLREVSAFGVVGKDTPLLKIRLTRMRGGGSVLGVLINHTLADGGSTVAFLESWSREHLGLPWEDPSHDRGALDALGRPSADPVTREARAFVGAGRIRHLTTTLRAGINKLATVTTRFGAAELAALKAEAQRTLQEPGAWVSTNDALTGHLWQVLGELRNRPAEATEWLGLIVGVRPRLGDALPASYWGNCVSNSWTSLTAGRLRESSLGSLARDVRRCLESNTEDKIRDEIAFLDSYRRKGVSRHVMSVRAPDVSTTSVSVNNWSQFPLYRIDLGAGRPFWYEFPDLPVPTVHIAPTPEEDGSRDVYLCLPESDAALVDTRLWRERLHLYSGSPTGP
ncbi:acyltransferase [Streptomyces hirsutus]|uniref:Acyltransferase n=1 Tax=Streptomyces hirsutus TaxID=35620 RepID=A0ABZ1GWE6_9ACTN|nr:acyltransferase [Streptomyces hirsutus]WSD10404.1 acyltransferase [Streptomyces hirsutus]WTD16247.1 acyltransferase [Streptomyces hirsutus]WTD78979.1 acyltransferase [Streptomyces sp. NBC_01635]